MDSRQDGESRKTERLRMNIVALPPDEAFFDALAARLIAHRPCAATHHDFSSLRVLAPSLPIAAELRSALVRRLPGAALLPVFGTLRQWAQIIPLPVAPLPPSRRLALLYEALRTRGWACFKGAESVLWGIVSEMAALFDELSEASVSLPDNAEALAMQLENAYALRASQPLAFEARIIHELWRALAISGEPDVAAAYRLQLSGLAQQAEALPPQSAPVFVVLDAAPKEALSAAEYGFYQRYAAYQSVHMVYPLPRESESPEKTPLLDTLAAAWLPAAPVINSASKLVIAAAAAAPTPMAERARAVAQRHSHSPLAGRLALVPAVGREPEAQAVVAQVGAWLQAGVRRIALIAQDRLTARRVRALLERERVGVSDETGWLLSTSRAAAAVDALLETVAGNTRYRDLLDVCKTPFFCADWPEESRQTAVFALETAIRSASVDGGLANIRQALVHSDSAGKEPAFAALERLAAAQALFDAPRAPLVHWLSCLHEALAWLGMQDVLANDIAGKALLAMLAARQEELAGDTGRFSFGAWRDWLRHEFESTSFRDDRVISPIVLTPLNAASLRRFEAAILIGGDARQLAPAGQGAFFNQAVRRELGLRTRADGERELRRDLELLLAIVPRVVVTWQSIQDGETNLLAPEFLLLSTLHTLAWGDDLQRSPLPPPPVTDAESATAPAPAASCASPAAAERTAVSVPAKRLPARISVSAYARLIACPYRFFASHVLRLGEMDEVREAMEKRDYGTLVHRSLQEFHSRCPCVSEWPANEALACLLECVEMVFAPAVADDFLAIAWRQRWEKRLPSYLDWQRRWEAEGWRWAQAERPVSRVFPLADDAGGGRVELYGRIDRIDRRGDKVASEAALLDYKTQRAASIKKMQQQDGDAQLSSYALLHEAAEAAYLALDDETVSAVPAGGDDLMALAKAQGSRLVSVFNAMHAGAPLPANGTDSVCQWCEMRGLCRKALPG